MTKAWSGKRAAEPPIGDSVPQRSPPRYPPGTQDANGRPVSLRVTNYELTSPRTNARVRAGVRVDLFPESKTNFDFVKLFIHSGKVWAVWRDDSSGCYDYDLMLSSMLAQYPNAAPKKPAS